MKPLKTIQQVLTWLCIYPPEKNIEKKQYLIYIAFSLTGIVALLSLVLASLAFIWKFIAIDFDASMDALYPIMGWIPLINAFVTMIRLKHQIVAIFDALSSIYNERKYLEEMNSYQSQTETNLSFFLNFRDRKRRWFNSIFNQSR